MRYSYSYGFCGDAIRVQVDGCEANEYLVVLGSFNIKASGLKSDVFCQPKYTFPNILPKSVLGADADKYVNSAKHPVNPWYVGRECPREGNSLFFEFNSERKGWHYGWFSTKTTKDHIHCFDIAVSDLCH